MPSDGDEVTIYYHHDGGPLDENPVWIGPVKLLEVSIFPEGGGYPGSWCEVMCEPDCHDTGCHELGGEG